MTPTADELRASLTDPHRALLDAIVAAPLAWTLISRFSSPDAEFAINQLEELDLVVRWSLPAGDVVTLTPWGAYVLRVEIDERFATVEGFTVEVPSWVLEGKADGPIVLPRYPREVRMPFPDRVPDRRPAPEVLTDETGKPVELFGMAIPIDPRMGGKHPNASTQAAIDRYLYRSPDTKPNGTCSMPIRTLSKG